MAKEEPPDDQLGLAEVRVMVVVVPGRIRATLSKLLRDLRVRAGLAALGLIAAVAAGTTIAASSSTSRTSRFLATYPSRPVDSHAEVTRFGMRLHCPRLWIVSPGGAYARVDVEATPSCGMYRTHVTLVLHRVHGVWTREFDASVWMCPMTELPRPIVTDLELCR